LIDKTAFSILMIIINEKRNIFTQKNNVIKRGVLLQIKKQIS